ncbi:MAG TPA: DUF222 domain-containing protein [Actinomycetes bacterium]|nr:DUF222 domain-containing protein [Actinomycetes bacterium]
MPRSLVDLPVREGWLPSWETDVDDWDPTGELLDESQLQDPVAVALRAQVAAAPLEWEPGPESNGGFASWQRGLPGLTDDELVRQLALGEQAIRQAQARQNALIAEFAARREGSYWINGGARHLGSDFVGDHLALALGVSLRSAELRINEAERLRAYPRLLAALGAGLVSIAGLRGVLCELAELDTVHAGAVEDHLLAAMSRGRPLNLATMSASEIGELGLGDALALRGEATPGRLRRWTRLAVARLDPDATRRARERAEAGACVELTPGAGSGMSWLGAWLPESQAAAGWERIDGEAQRRLHEARDAAQGAVAGADSAPLDGEPLSLDALRAQVFFDLLMSTDAWSGADPVPVQLTVVMERDGTATLDPLGPVPWTTLAATADLAMRTGGSVRTKTEDPAGCPGEHPGGGRDDPYVPPASLARAVRRRDQTCRYPGCVRSASDCDLDHTIPWPDGPTCACNLAALCRHHHRLKTHEPGWRLTNHGDGRLTWQTPYGSVESWP